MSNSILERFNPEELGGIPIDDLAERIRHSPTGWPELNGVDRAYSVSDTDTWQELSIYESIIRRAGGFTIWTCTDGFILEGYSTGDGLHPNKIITVHLPKNLSFGD